MTVRSVPVMQDYSRAYWDAARQGRLAIQRCLHCRRHYFPPYPECLECGSGQVEWTEVSGRGRVHTVAIVRDPVLPGLDDRLPLVCALVELDEAPEALIPSNILIEPGAAVLPGDALTVDFEQIGDDVALPVFRPVQPSTSGGDL